MNRRTHLTGLASSLFASRSWAQQRPPLVAVLSPASPGAAVVKLVNEPFKIALTDLGYEAGRNIEFAERFAHDDEPSLPALAAALVSQQPRVIFTNTNAAAVAAADATRTIPIVVGPAGEVVMIELAGGSLARPTTNVTGFVLTSPDIDAKCIALLMEAVPSARRIGVLINPRNPGQREYPSQQQRLLAAASVELIRLELGAATGMEASFEKAIAERVDALFVADDPQIAANPPIRERILRFAAANRLPVASSHMNYAHDGALLSMGPSIPALAVRAAGYVDKILKGATPDLLPIERPSVLFTVVNLKTAALLALTMPPSILIRADQIIE